MLKLRRATVTAASAPDGPMQDLEIEVDGAQRRAQADVGMVGLSEAGDDLVVNVEAVDLALGSGGFDVVHVNLTRGLAGGGTEGAHVMKLNYSSLQHAVNPVEGEELSLPLGRPVAAFSLHGQLAPVAWAFSVAAPGKQLGYVQTLGGALPGGLSRAVREMRARGLLAGHITSGPTYGGEAEAITVAGAIHHSIADLGWDAVICGPGPGILGSASALGHGGIHVLDSAHAALGLGCPVFVVARMSSGDQRPRHQGLSHHTETVLRLLLAPVTVALPAGEGEKVKLPGRRHERYVVGADLDGYKETGLPAKTMGRTIDEDPPFFAAALAAGTALGDWVTSESGSPGS